MSSTDNIFNTTQKFMSPDFIHKFSIALDEPQDKIQAGLRTAIPTFLTELIDEASTDEGAQKIVNLVSKENFETATPNNLMDEWNLTKGESAAENIMGENYSFISKNLTRETGLHGDSADKLIGIVASSVLGTLNYKIKKDKLDASSLSHFLRDQRNVLKGFVPIKNTMNDDIAIKNVPRKIPFKFSFILILFVLIALVLLLARMSIPVSKITTIFTDVHESQSRIENPTIANLETFLQTMQKKDLPQKFNFTTLSFAPGTTDYGYEAEKELSLIADALKKHPRVLVTIEGFTEETQSENENVMISENRAMLIREEIVGLGVEPSRIKAEGKGVGSDNVQIQLVITNLIE
jgi:hypothetical protein